MARLLYLDNPADRTVTWMGVTVTYEWRDHCRAIGVSPWTGRQL